MKSQRNPGSIPIPGGNTKVENPDGVMKTYGDEVVSSAYDASFFGDGCSYGAFARDYADGPFLSVPMSGRKRETTNRNDD